MAQSCVSLASSTTCPGFNASSISTDATLVGFFPFLANVDSTKSFDSQLKNYVGSGYAQEKYQNLFGCSNFDLSNTTDLYARYTISFLCNSIIQNSIQPCGLSTQDSRPLCVDSCAEFALSEQTIISSPELCGSTNSDAIKLLRADFVNCALPAKALSNACIPAYDNEPDDCGFQSNLEGLCSFCRGSSINATDSCCVTANVDKRCKNVHLPIYTSMPSIFTTTVTGKGSSSTSTAGPSSSGSRGNRGSHGQGLTGGQIAGIVVGSVVGAALLLGLLICACIYMRRKRARDEQTSLNQPTPPRSGVPPTQPPPRFEALPGARVTRMAALEGSPGSSPHNNLSGQSTSGAENSPDAGLAAGGVDIITPKRGPEQPVDRSSAETGGFTTDENGQSEQMAAFKDYYSSDEIHSGDLVSVLWAYQPRAQDEFELDRGDMLRIVGIWDDGWATGVRVQQRADEWTSPRGSQRDSVVSQEESPPQNGDVKAFPLVCVCLPQHWRKTIEGDSSATDPPSSD